MKQIKLNISELDYEKFRLEALCERRDISSIIRSRIFYKPFDADIEAAFESLMEQEIHKL